MFLIVPVNSTCYKIMVSLGFHEVTQVENPNRNYSYNTPTASSTILRDLIFRSKGSASCMKTRRVKLSDDKLALREAST